MPEESKGPEVVMDAVIPISSWLSIATQVLAGLVSTGTYDGSNPHHVNRATDIALAYADNLIEKAQG